MVFTMIGGKTYVYVSESNEISRFRYDSHKLLNKEVVVPDLPDTSSPDLRGAYRPELITDGHSLNRIQDGPSGLDDMLLDPSYETNRDLRTEHRGALGASGFGVKGARPFSL
jgi:hypothetical protein